MENSEKKMATIFDFAKMCKSSFCAYCPISTFNNGYETYCADFLKYYPEEANDKILAWLKEEEKKNKVKTYEDDFFEKFPNAAREHDGSPIICIKSIYPELADKLRCFPGNCKVCWNLPYKEED